MSDINIKTLNLHVNLMTSAMALLDAANDLMIVRGSPAARYMPAHDGQAVLDSTTSLMWSADTIGDRVDFACAEKVVSALRIGGHTDWRLPTRAELLTLVDDTRHEPCIDTEHFKSNSAWYWTSTKCAWSSAPVWIVNFGNGHVYHNHRDLSAFVRAVRASSPASQ